MRVMIGSQGQAPVHAGLYVTELSNTGSRRSVIDANLDACARHGSRQKKNVLADVDLQCMKERC